MRQNLERFLKALRGMDVPVSVAEAIDAHRTAALVGWSDRTLLRDALAVAVAKSEDEKARYFECFDAFFAAAGASRDPDRATAAETAGETLRAADADPDRPAGDLVRMLLDGDRAGVSAAMAAAAGEVDLSRLRLFTQRGVFMRRILDAMGIGDLETEIRSLRAAPDDPAATERADRLEDARERLIEESRDLVERNIALFADPASARLREEFLERMRLANIPPRDFERGGGGRWGGGGGAGAGARPGRGARVALGASGGRRGGGAKRLASRHARRRFNRKDGRLDPRRTIRSNIAHDGVPFRLAWRYTRVERPKVVAVCDVSGSVAATAQFLLLLLHSMREVMSDFRAFAFSSHLEEVDDLLGGRPFEEAAAGIMERIGFRPTDYGRTLVDLEEGYLDVIDRRTTVIVLGDGRNNRGDPRTASLERIFQRAKRVIWLNPEPRTFWGTGDSEMLRYLPWCHVARVCNTLRHLERAVDDLLAARA